MLRNSCLGVVVALNHRLILAMTSLVTIVAYFGAIAYGGMLGRAAKSWRERVLDCDIGGKFAEYSGSRFTSMVIL